MPLRDLLVHLDSSAQGLRRLDYAARLAARHEAHLTGLYLLDLVPSLAELARAYPGRIEQFESYGRMREAELKNAQQVEAGFRDTLRRNQLAGEWRFLESPPAETAALHARYADLVILGQVDPGQGAVSNETLIPEETLLTSGRPVLLVPYAGSFATTGENVLVAWKPTREAARALGDALPLLERAAKVTVLTVDPDRGPDVEPGIPAADIALHLTRHGVRAEAATTVAAEIAIGDALLNYAADLGADLLVMGGYGHSRAREAVWGGVTRQILRQMTLPVLMAH